MKILKFAALILTVLVINSCLDIYKGDDEKETRYCCNNYYEYNLFLSFQDESGNDLLDGNKFVRNNEVSDEVKPESYIVIDKLNATISQRLYYKEIKFMADYDYYLCLNAMRDLYEFSEKIVFRFKCFSLFGDNNEHNIVAWWKRNDNNSIACYRVEYEGKEFPLNKLYNLQTVTIILDR